MHTIMATIRNKIKLLFLLLYLCIAQDLVTCSNRPFEGIKFRDKMCTSHPVLSPQRHAHVPDDADSFLNEGKKWKFQINVEPLVPVKPQN